MRILWVYHVITLGNHFVRKVKIRLKKVLDEALNCFKIINLFFRGYKMKKFNGKNFRDGLLEIYPNMYLTWLSMIQGVVFGLIMYNGVRFILDAYISFFQKISIVIYILLSIEILLLIWFDYLFNNIFKRIPNLRDLLFPIVFGILQGGLTFFLDDPKKWMIICLLIGIIACFVYHNTRIQVLKEMIFEEIHKQCRYNFQLKVCFKKVQIEKVRLIWILLVTILLFLMLRFFNFRGFNQLILDIIFFILLTYFQLISFNATFRLYQNVHEIISERNPASEINEVKVWKKLKIDFFNIEKKWIQKWAERVVIKLESKSEENKLKALFKQEEK